MRGSIFFVLNILLKKFEVTIIYYAKLGDWLISSHRKDESVFDNLIHVPNIY